MSGTVPRGPRRVRSLDRPALVALGLGLLGVGYRLALILLTVPGSNSDEATFGLVAKHIAEGRKLPVFLYGQHYMGTVESYLAAPLFALFGPSWVLLRLPLLFLYAAFVYLVYRLTRRLYSPWLATFTVGLLALGSERVVRDQITAVGGRPELKPTVVVLLLLALALGQRQIRHRLLAFSGFGFLAGVCVWDDWLVLPYLAVTVAVLLVGCWRELFGPATPLLLGGFLVGVSPLIVDNLTAPPGEDSLSVLMQVSGGEGAVTALADRLHGAVLVGVPLATGLCPPDRCAPWQMSWGVLYLALLLIAATLAVVGLGRRGGGTPDGSAAQRRMRYVGQLALPLAAALTLLAYLRNPLAASAPLASARYLSILQISLPAALWPLWLAARAAGHSTATTHPWHGISAALFRRGSGLLAGAILAVLAATMLGTTALLISQLPAIRAQERQSRELASAVEQAGIRNVYGEYWTCNRLIFITRERVSCAVLGPNLRPGQNRYPPYQVRVRAADRPAFLFEAGAAADVAFRAYLHEHTITATVTEVGTYRLYQPTITVRPSR